MLPKSVESAIAELPLQFAAVIRLVDLDERSYKDAADHLGIPVGTVMSRLFRGRRLLASRLGKVEGNSEQQIAELPELQEIAA